MKTGSVYHWNQNRNKAENKCSSLQQRYLFICLFDYKALFVCLKDKQYQPIPSTFLDQVLVSCFVYLLNSSY